MAELQDYSTTANSNNASSPNGMPEDMAPSGVNDSWREGMARVARERDDTQGVTATGGSSNAYTLAAVRDTAAAYVGEMFCFRANHTNTAAATLNVTPAGGSARGTKAIQQEGAAIGPGVITSGGVYFAVYDGTQYQLTGAVGYNGNETQATPSISSGAVTVDLDAAQNFKISLSESITTLTISNPPPSGTVRGFTIQLLVTGSFTVSWPASVEWPAGTAPTLSTSSGDEEIFSFFTEDGGTTYKATGWGQAVS